LSCPNASSHASILHYHTIMTNRITKLGLLILTLICALQVPARSQSVINRSLATTERAGVLEPYKSTEVATAEMGVVRELFVKAGETIESGALIGRLDHEQQRVQVREAELDAASFGMLETAKRELEFNTRRVEEISKLVSSGKGSPKELERYQLEFNIAKAKLQAQEESKLVSQARLDKAQLLLNERTIRAPHQGTVVEVYKDVGEYIAGNSPAIIRLVDTSRLRARFYLSDEIADRFRKLGQAEVRLANHVVVKATVEFVAPFAIAEGGVIEMTVLIENENGSIRSSNCELVLP
jgi:RND family efflux transporter MFP subunit